MKTLILVVLCAVSVRAETLWEIGKQDRTGSEFALAPKHYGEFKDDGFHVVGRSPLQESWPYVHPGPKDSWAGGRPHTFTIIFGVKQTVREGECRLVVDLVDTHYGTPPKLSIEINGRKFGRQMPKGASDEAINGDPARGKPHRFTVEFPVSLLQAGNNQIDIVNADGSWILYDHLALETPAGVLSAPTQTITKLRDVQALPALIERDGKLYQPVNVTVSHLGDPTEATLQGVPVQLKNGTQTLESLLPAVEKETEVTMKLVVDTVPLASAPVAVKPVRHWTVYILMHSHVDIGYTAVQTEIEQKQAHNLARALELIRETKDYPAGTRFKWNTEVFWPVDQFYKTATTEQKNEFEQAVRDGYIGIDAMYANLLTGVCRNEELIRQFKFATEFGRRCGVTVDAMMISDVPGLTWGTVPAAAQNGVKYISNAPNYIDRIGWARVTWEDKPFWWTGPDGKSKVLYWAPYMGYAYGHTIDTVPQAVTKLLPHLDATGYPYDLVQLRWSKGDNGSADERVMQQVRDWNAKYAWPKLVIATTSEMFHEFEKRYGDKLPIFRGDFTPYWEDGVGSAARETAMNRHSADRLLQAENLWRMLAPDKLPAAEFDAAWKNVIMWSEHTWGAHCSVSKPDSDFTKAQWEIKQAFALDADRQSRKLLTDALAQRKGEPVPNAIDVFHTTSQAIPWAHVVVPKELSLAGDTVRASTANEGALVSQRLSTGELVFQFCWLGGAIERFHITSDKASSASSPVKAEGAILTTPKLALRVDEKTGAIVSLRLVEKGVELVDTNATTGLNDFFYLPGGDLKGLQRNGPVKISVKERGPLIASLLIESDAPGCRKLTREIRLHAFRNYVEIINTVDKLPVRQKEGVHFGFAFNIPGGVTRINSPGAVVEPEKDQIPGACKNWFSVERRVDIMNKDYGVTWVTMDAPLVELGTITANLPATQPNPKAYMEHIAPSQTLYSWAMNNHWHTNYKADQDGPTTFRYFIFPRRLFPEPPQPDIEQGQPLIVAPAVGAKHNAED